jgi:cysteine-rich repeat protein
MTQYSVTFNTPSDTITDGRLMFLFNGADVPGSSIWIDDVVLTPGGGAVCGNGVIEAGEQCDDGNTANGDGCSSTCAIEPVCGNGIVQAGEECDDGNTTSGDGCSSTCQLEAGNNLIVNGNFSAGEPPWVFFTNAQGDFDVVSGEARVTFATDATNVQLYQHNIAAASSTSHTLTFRARHSLPNKRITIRFSRHTSPFNSYGLARNVTLSTTMTQYSMTFTTTSDTITDGRLMFLLNDADTPGSTVWFDDVVLTEN